MSITVKFRRGNTATSNGLTLANGELYIDTSKRTVVVHDGSTLGGNPLATESALVSGLANKTTPEYVNTAIQTSISQLVNAAPSALDTLNELAAALGNNPNYATTITTALGTKQSTLVSGTNIKTINGTSILGSGNLPIVQFGLLSETNVVPALKDVVSSTTLTLDTGVFLNGTIKKFNDESGAIQVSQYQNPQRFNISNTTLPSTYEFWFYPTRSNAEFIFGILGANGNDVSVQRNGSLYTTDVTGTYGGLPTGNSQSITNNTWNHVAVYLSTTQVKVWFNGTSVVSYTFPFPPTTPDDYRMSNPRTGIALGGAYNGWEKPEGYYGQILISNGDKYGVANNTITVPTSSFTTSNASYLIKYMLGDQHLDISSSAKLNAAAISASSIVVLSSHSLSGYSGDGSIYAAGPISSSNSVTGTTFIGDGSQLTNVKSIPSVWTYQPLWQQTVSGSSYFPTGTIQSSQFSKTLTPSKTGYLQITYYPKDIYCLQQIGHVTLIFSVTSGGNEYSADYGFDNAVVGSNKHGPYRLIVPVTEASTITMRMKWLLLNPSAGGDYFNYGGNDSYDMIFAEYVTTVNGSTF